MSRSVEVGSSVRAAALAVTLLTVLAPWPYASVEPLWRDALIAPLLLIGIVTLAAAVRRRGPLATLSGRAMALAALIPGVALLGAVPLPAFLVDLVQPSAGRLLSAAAVPPRGWTTLSLDPATTLDAAALAAAIAVVAVVVIAAARQPRVRAALAAILCVGGTAVAVFGVVHVLTVRDSETMFWSVRIAEVGTPFGPFVNRNHFGGAMVLFAGSAVGLFGRAFEGRRFVSAGIWGICACALGAALIATTSRGAVLGAGTASVAFIALARGKSRRRAAAALGVAALVGLAVLIGTGRGQELLVRVTSLSGRWTARFAVQLDALRVVLDFPVFGTGAGSFETTYTAVQTIEPTRSFSNAHSDWVQILMETGLLGAALLVAVTLEVGRVVRRGLEAAGPERWMIAGPIAACLGVAAHGLFEVNLHVPSNALLAACTLSIAYATSLDVHDGHAGGAARSSGRMECSDESEAEATGPPVCPSPS